MIRKTHQLNGKTVEFTSSLVTVWFWDMLRGATSDCGSTRELRDAWALEDVALVRSSVLEWRGVGALWSSMIGPSECTGVWKTECVSFVAQMGRTSRSTVAYSGSSFCDQLEVYGQ